MVTSSSKVKLIQHFEDKRLIVCADV